LHEQTVSLAAIFTHFGHFASGRLSRNPHLPGGINWDHQTKSRTYSTNTMTIIRTGQQNGEVLEFFEKGEVWKLSKKEI